MGIMIGFGPRQKARQFKYKPRQYDPEQERREERRRAILGDKYTQEYTPGILIRDSRLRRRQMENDVANRKSKSALVRTTIFVALIFGIVWLAMHYFELSVSDF